MILYLLRWQWVLLKRQLFSAPMLINLVVNLIFQIGIVIAVLADPKSYADNIVMFLLYASAMSLSQTMNGFSQSLVIASMGLLGIAPIEHRPKMAMVLFNLVVFSTINAGLISLGLSISLLLHGDGAGVLLLFVLTFFTGVCLYAGLGAGLTTLVSRWLPARLKAQAGAILSPFMFLLIIVIPLLQDHDPVLVHHVGELFANIASHPEQSGPQVMTLLSAALFGILMAILPFLRMFQSLSVKNVDVSSHDSRTYKSRAVPTGLMRLLMWRDAILFQRTRGVGILPGLFALVLFSVLPGQVSGVGFIFLGMQMGAFVFNGVLTRSLPLLYLAPIQLSSYWIRRFFIIVPQTFILCFAYFVLASAIHHAITFMTGVDDMAKATLSVAAMSFSVFFMPQGRGMDAAGRKARKARLTGWALVTTLLTSAAPFGLAALNSSLPIPGLVLDIGLTVGIFLFGPTFLKTKTSLQYPMRG